MVKLSVIVPCYNEEDVIERFFDAAAAALSSIESYELIFVNDGSRDATLEKLKKLFQSRKDVCMRILDFSKNFGKEAAMLAGLKAAEGEYVAIIDADLQQRPEILCQMAGILDSEPEYDCVAAFQQQRKENKLIKGIKGLFYKIMNRASSVELKDGASDFRMFRRAMVESIVQMPEYHRFSKGIFSWVGFRTKYIPYDVQAREGGESKWSFRSLFHYAVDGIVSFTTAPLKLATVIGTVMFFVSIVYIAVIVIEKLFFGIAVAGYASIVALILLFGGLQLLCIGIIGEYIAKIYEQVKNRPVYIIKKEYRRDEEKDAS
ncbi:MAG TPA: glycosyltransferase family 2 protein [Candidatus Scubalenecus merdavium]|uniref:Glycosyltransferase family 2 protein n=1 Tax=Candidatus Scybalenecus merdavium TaxID=2840939 RepID=A0A9D1MTT5_9FIRM|nr:glycosyltransferase family 2 protein [Candidatus Scubalenecus merdavium]